MVHLYHWIGHIFWAGILTLGLMSILFLGYPMPILLIANLSFYSVCSVDLHPYKDTNGLDDGVVVL